MKLRKLAKDGASPTGECPAVYAPDADDETNDLVVQGKRLDADTTTNLEDHAADEDGVRIPAETVIRAARRYIDEYGDPTA